MLKHLMTSWHLNIWKVKIWLSQERKELSKWNKMHFSLFHKCSLLDIQNKLAKMWQTQLLRSFCYTASLILGGFMTVELLWVDILLIDIIFKNVNVTFRNWVRLYFCSLLKAAAVKNFEDSWNILFLSTITDKNILFLSPPPLTVSRLNEYDLPQPTLWVCNIVKGERGNF